MWVETACGSALVAVGSALAAGGARNGTHPEGPGSAPIWTSAGSFEGLRCSARVKRAVVSPCGAPREALCGVGVLPGLDDKHGTKHTLAGGLMHGILQAADRELALAHLGQCQFQQGDIEAARATLRKLDDEGLNGREVKALRRMAGE